GDLTLHGVTKEISVDLEPVGPVSGPRGEGAGFETFFTIKRSDYGMNFMLDKLGDEVKLIVSIEGHR
ncbi:MAG TPA: YceI family protein, partial [Phycisphaerae bacterium]|nr:YceI family protein [Phycisphaerae bacterium]